MRVFQIVFLATLLSSVTLAAPLKAKRTPASPCTWKQWPFSQSQLQKQDYDRLKMLDRKLVLNYWLHELTSLKPRVQLVRDLHFFLSSTEPSKEYQAFYEVVAESSSLKGDEFQALKQSDVCDLLKRVEAKLPES